MAFWRKESVLLQDLTQCLAQESPRDAALVPMQGHRHTAAICTLQSRNGLQSQRD